YDEAGLNGLVIPTPYTETQEPSTSDASHYIFVYMNNPPAAEYRQLDQVLPVTCDAGAHIESMQLTNPSCAVAEGEYAPRTPRLIDTLTAGDAEREPYEYMLVLPGNHTVTNNYALNTFGEIGLAPGEEAFRQPTDFMAPGA